MTFSARRPEFSSATTRFTPKTSNQMHDLIVKKILIAEVDHSVWDSILLACVYIIYSNSQTWIEIDTV